MKTLTQDEQKFVQNNILDISSNCTGGIVIANLYEDVFYKYNFKFKYKEKKLEFYRTIDELNVDEILAIEEFIIRRTTLIKFLIDNDYLYVVDIEHTEQLPDLGGFEPPENTYPISHNLPKDISDIICKYAFQRAYVTPELKEFAKYDFKTAGERQLEEAKKQSGIAERTFHNSIVAVILSAVIPLLVGLFVPTTICKKQIKSLQENKYQISTEQLFPATKDTSISYDNSKVFIKAKTATIKLDSAKGKNIQIEELLIK